MSYTPINWNNNTTPINETNLNKMDQGIAGLSNMLDNHTFEYLTLNATGQDLLEFLVNNMPDSGTKVVLFITGSGTTNLPNTSYQFSVGLALQRQAGQYSVLIFNRHTGDIAVNTSSGNVWRGWYETASQSDITVKEYTATLATNANVSPFTAYGTMDIANEVALYGNVISCLPIVSSSTDICMSNIKKDQSGIYVYGMKETTVTLRVTYKKTT